MCGIAGIVDVARLNPGYRRLRVERAVDVMKHRGPDDAVACDVGPTAAWGMCRLAIRDPSPSGRQPFWHGDIGVVFNGEIYNTEQLSTRLEGRGHVFKTECDTEVLLKAYVEYGTDAFALLDGIFAAAVVDGTLGQLILARDEFGVKPLFLNSSHSRLVFASEPKALKVLGGLEGGIDEEQLVRYLRYQYVPEPGSPWAGVRKLPRGSCEVYSLDRAELLRSQTFSQPRSVVDVAPSDGRGWVEATAAGIQESVTRQLVSDRPLGVFLSGGIDSTLIASYACKLHPGVRAFGVSVPTWDRDERKYMEEACAHLDVNLTIASFEETDFDRLLARVLDTYDEPFADFSALPTMLVSEVAGQELRVVLSGDGGDELFGGYDRYRAAPTLERIGRLPPTAVRWLANAIRHRNLGAASLAERVSDELAGGGHPYAALLALRSHVAAASLLGRTPERPWALAPVTVHRRPWREKDAWDTAMNIDQAQYLPADIHTKVDRATMSVSLEARVPLLGAPVASVAAPMPPQVKMHNGVGKWPLKQLLLDQGFSSDFVHRQKTGFSFPISSWLRRAIARRSDYEDLLRQAPAPIDRAMAGKSLDALLEGADAGHLVWTILILSHWLTRYAG